MKNHTYDLLKKARPVFMRIPSTEIDMISDGIDEMTVNKNALGKYMYAVRNHGMMISLLVNARDGRYRLISGQIQWQTAINENITEVPCVVYHNLDDVEELRCFYESYNRHSFIPIKTKFEHCKKLYDLFSDIKLVKDRENAVGDVMTISGRQVRKYIRIYSQATPQLLNDLYDNRISLSELNAILPQQGKKPL